MDETHNQNITELLNRKGKVVTFESDYKQGSYTQEVGSIYTYLL